MEFTSLKRAVSDWVVRAYSQVLKDVYQNLNGTVLKRQSHNLYRSIGKNSWYDETSFTIGTDVGYGKAWEKGFYRPEYTFGPREGRPYASPKWEDKILPASDKRARLRFFWHGKETFARTVTIPARQFEARPWLSTAFMKNRTWMKQELRRSIHEALGRKDIRIRFVIGHSTG